MIFNIFYIKAHHFIKGRAAPAINLPETRYPGLAREQSPPVPGVVKLVFVRDGRPRSHQGHLAFQDIDQLRKLIEAVFPQEATGRRDPGISPHLENGAGHLALVEQLGVEDKDVVPTASFIDDLGADSLDLVELIMALEEEFSSPGKKVEIPDAAAEKLITVQDALDYLKDLGVSDK